MQHVRAEAHGDGGELPGDAIDGPDQYQPLPAIHVITQAVMLFSRLLAESLLTQVAQQHLLGMVDV